MKTLLSMLLILVSLGANATTYAGHIEFNKTNNTEIKFTYHFVLSKADSLFTSSGFSSSLMCPSTLTSVPLSGIQLDSKQKQYLNCARTEYNWIYEFSVNVDLTDSKYNNIKTCCHLKVDATCGSRSTDITTLTTTGSPFYVFTDFENCNTPINRSPASASASFSRNCTNQPFYNNNGMLDTANFDSLSYELVNPLGINGTSLAFKSGYYADQPHSSFYPAGKSYPFTDPSSSTPIGFYLDPITGDIIYIPVSVVDNGPVTLEIKEWRKNTSGTYEEISKMHKELFIYTALCPDNNPPTLEGPYSYTIKYDSTLCFNINTDDVVFVPPPPASPPAPDSVKLSWDQGIPTAVFTVMNPTARLQTGQFCWTPTKDKVSSIPYTFTATARDNACPTNATSARTYRIYVTDGTNDISNSKRLPLTLYPNPAINHINLTKVMDHISITDALGREIKKSTNLSTVDIKELELGIYNVECIKDDIIYIGRFIKE